jgi:hypothetical protein
MLRVIDLKSMKHPLRVALLVNSFTQPRWVYEIVRRLQASDVARLTLIIKRTVKQSSNGRRGGLLKRTLGADRALFALYSKIDNLLFHSEPDPLTPTDIGPLVHNCDLLHAVTVLADDSEYLTDADVERISAYDLHVVILCGITTLRGRALDIARFGVWSCDSGDDFAPDRAPYGFREVMEGRPTTCSTLKILHEPPRPNAVIYRAHTRTDARSVTRNRRNSYWKSSALLQRKLRDVYQRGPDGIFDHPDAASAVQYDDCKPSAPNNTQMARMLTQLVSRFMRDKLRRLLSWEQWILAYRIGGPVSDGADGPDLDFSRFKTLIPPSDRFWADPFPVTIGDRYFIFFEEWIYRYSKGHICVLEVDATGPISQPLIVLERAYHLSHPFVFEWDGTYFLLPETYENRTVELYRAKAFPDQWEPAGILLSDIIAVDATLARLGELWWMFVNVGTEQISTSDELHLFFAESPLGPWKPHGRNPVKSDVRSARPAGGILSWNGAFYRPSQDCSTSYGAAIDLNEMERIDPDQYREVTVRRLSFDSLPGVTGMHTINTAADLTVIDARVKRCRLLQSTRWSADSLTGRSRFSRLLNGGLGKTSEGT